MLDKILEFGIITNENFICIQRGGGIRALRNPATGKCIGANSPRRIAFWKMSIFIGKALLGLFFLQQLRASCPPPKEAEAGFACCSGGVWGGAPLK